MYEERFGTDWTTIDDREEAVERAFALGVAARLGERHPGELDRINDAVDTTYDRSFVELAYHEGREKASELAPKAAEDEQVWEELVEEKTVIDPDERPDPTIDEERNDGLPDAVRGMDVDSRPEDSRETVERPSFLDRERGPGSSYDSDAERTVFGRKRDDVESSATPSADDSQSASDEEEGEDGVTESPDGNGDVSDAE